MAIMPNYTNLLSLPFNFQLKNKSLTKRLLWVYKTWLISFFETPNSVAIFEDFICFEERRILILSSKVGPDWLSLSPSLLAVK